MISKHWKASFGLENNYKEIEFWFQEKTKFLFDMLGNSMVLYGCEV
jgi:hypothetical protein